MAPIIAPFLARDNFQSLVNLHLTPEIVTKALRLLKKQRGRHATFANLSHISFSMTTNVPYTTRRRQVQLYANFISKCPSVTSLGMHFYFLSNQAHNSCRALLSARIPPMLPIHNNLVSLSINLGFNEGKPCVIDAFPEELSLESVRNLRICTNYTDNFQDKRFFSKICDRFPKVSFLYLAFRHSRCLRREGDSLCHREYRISDIEFSENVKSSVKTLALDECFYTEKNVEKLGEFQRLEKVIVAVLDANDYFIENRYSLQNVQWSNGYRNTVRYVRVQPPPRVRRALKWLKKKVVTKRGTGDRERRDGIYEEVQHREILPPSRLEPFNPDCVLAHRCLNADVKAKEVKLSTIWTSLNDD